MLYVVMLEHSDGRITFVGKESWSNTDSPEAVFTLASAQGKARWWRKLSRNEHNNDTDLMTISIKPVRLEVSAGVEELIIP